MTTFILEDIALEALTADEVQARLLEFLRSKTPHHLITVNPEYLVEAHRNTQFRSVLKAADMALIDGGGIVFMALLRGLKVSLRQRMTGVALTEMLLKMATAHDKRILIVLPTDSLTNNAKLHDALRSRYPSLHASILTEPDAAACAAERPDILLCAYGSPRQDLWLAETVKKIPGLSIAAGVGGTFDFISGTMRRAPRLLRHLGLEWFWRLIQEPRRRFPRIFRAVIVFPLLALRHHHHE